MLLGSELEGIELVGKQDDGAELLGELDVGLQLLGAVEDGFELLGAGVGEGVGTHGFVIPLVSDRYVSLKHNVVGIDPDIEPVLLKDK